MCVESQNLNKESTYIDTTKNQQESSISISLFRLLFKRLLPPPPSLIHPLSKRSVDDDDD